MAANLKSLLSSQYLYLLVKVRTKGSMCVIFIKPTQSQYLYLLVKVRTEVPDNKRYGISSRSQYLYLLVKVRTEEREYSFIAVKLEVSRNTYTF